MQAIKELVDDLGGGRALLGGGSLLVFLLVASHSWMESREETEAAIKDRLGRIESRIRHLEKSQAVDEALRIDRDAHRATQGFSLDRRLNRLEREADERAAADRQIAREQ